jgi:hypothetical protein
MILRRLAHNLREQNWTAIVIEFVLLVLGVFLGMQVSNWNQARVDDERARGYLARMRSDLDTDLVAYADRRQFWKDVYTYGSRGLAYAETGDARGATPWELLLAYFQASQVAEFHTVASTFEELKSAGELGLVRDAGLRNLLEQYYSFGDNPVLSERPRYREHVRGTIPLEVQDYIWTHCYSSDQASVQKMLSCEPPIDETRTTSVVDAIRGD